MALNCRTRFFLSLLLCSFRHLFFIPVSLVAAELATGWPKKGGVFVWVKEAFGHKTGFLAIWLLWLENVFWYPLVLSFLAATIAYLFNPALAQSGIYTTCVILVFIWAATIFNLLNMKTSGWISTMGAICGTFIPGALIITLGAIWYFSGRPMEIAFTFDNLIPDFSNPGRLAFFTGVMLSLGGLEMSAVHASDVKDPQKNYPRAIMLSALLILSTYILGVLSIAIVIPSNQISLISGSLQAFTHFLNAYGLSSIMPFLIFMVILGSAGALSTWIIGPCKGLLAAAQSGDLPPVFQKTTKQGMPLTLLITQAIIVSLLSLLFIFMPTLSSAYWVMTIIAAQLYLVMYGLMFASAIKLKYKRPEVVRAYQVPGGKAGMWFVGGLGLFGSVACFIVGFLPPPQAATANTYLYSGILLAGILLSCCFPSLVLLFKKASWTR